MYKSQDATVFVCHHAIGKAFDHVNHDKLYRIFDKKYIMRIIIFWYESQLFYFKGGFTNLQNLGSSNGAGQGGILSLHFVNLYRDELSVTLNDCKTGCCFSST